MARFGVGNLEPSVEDRVQRRAKRNGRSREEEVARFSDRPWQWVRETFGRLTHPERSHVYRERRDWCGPGSLTVCLVPPIIAWLHSTRRPGGKRRNLTAARRAKGRAADSRDTMRAGIVLAHHARLAIRNASRSSDVTLSVVDSRAA